MARRYYSSIAAQTTLSAGVDSSTATIPVTAVSGWPSSFPYTLLIDKDTVNEEIVSVTGRTGTTLTVTRGVDGSSGVAHSAGANVQHGVSARDFDEPNAFINGTGVVTSTMIADGTIVNADVNASAAIAQSKIADLTTDLAAKADLSLTSDTKTANYTLVLGDAGESIEMNVASANTLTVPLNSSVAFPVGTTILLIQVGAGQTTITPTAGVTVNATPGLKLRAQWSVATLIKRGTDVWIVAGDVIA